MKQATRRSNILDKVFTNISKFYAPPPREVVAPLGLSDHRVQTHRLIRDAPPSKRKIVGNLLSNVNWTRLYHMESCEDQFQFFSSILNNIVQTFLPVRRVKVDTNDKPWITPEIKDLISKRQSAWSSGNSPMFKFYRNKVNVLCKKAHVVLIIGITSQMFNNLIHLSGGPLSRISQVSIAMVYPILMWHLLICSMTNLSLLARFFLLWNGRQFLSMLFLQNFLSWRHRKFPARFQTSFISRSWQDPGLVTSRKCVTIKSPFVFHFNASLREGYIPLQWKSAIVSPIPKSAPALDAVDNDFRPISLTAIISKILESFLYQWHLLSIFDKIDPLQFSSLKGSSTTMALVYLLHKWYDKLGSSLRICLLDFSKAFDRIDHNILLNKLQLMDVHPVLVNLITNCIQVQWRAPGADLEVSRIN